MIDSLDPTLNSNWLLKLADRIPWASRSKCTVQRCLLSRYDWKLYASLGFESPDSLAPHNRYIQSSSQSCSSPKTKDKDHSPVRNTLFTLTAILL